MTARNGAIAPILIFGYGNPSRGDDALGPMLLEFIKEHSGERADIELLTDFQLQVEHSLDMVGRQLVLFVDASVSSPAPFEFVQLERPGAAASTLGYTTHTLTPSELLQSYQMVHHHAAPPSFLLTIRGEQFELGAPLSATARNNLDQSQQWLVTLLTSPSLSRWQRAEQAQPRQVA